MFNNINFVCKNAELLLNIGAVIPGANVAVSGIRATFGKAQIIGGLAFAAIAYTASLLTALYDRDLSNYFRAAAIKSVEYIKHGLLNCVRSYADLVPVLSILLLINDLVFDIGKYNYTPFNSRANNISFSYSY